FQFAISGDGPLKNDLMNTREKFGLKKFVHFLGIRKDIADLLSAADIFLLTSHWEGLSISLLEAMSLAKPIVTTSAEGTNQVIESGVNGILVPIGDVKTISDVVVSLSNDENRKEKLGKSAQESITRKFSLETVCLEYQKLFYTIIRDSHMN
ncbi:MAG: glycosyltransferase, partial [Anaerolineae bacterium]|nr:glycosyltransferase [Anaerolineae bacterium]